MRLVPHRLIERHSFEDVEQLTLVFVDAFDLDIEKRGRIDQNIETLPDQPRQRDLVVVLDAPELLLGCGRWREVSRFFEQRWVRRVRLRRRVSRKRSVELRIRHHQPSAESNAVGLVGDAAG